MLGYRFQDDGNIRRALTHRSASPDNYERLEFLGDALLDFIVGELLFNAYPKATEGELSRMRSAIVNKSALAALANRLNIRQFVILGPAETGSNREPRESIRADILEAIVAAVYLDGGIVSCRTLVNRLLGERVQNARRQLRKDAKTRLQELMQAQGKTLPAYSVTSVSGKPHAQEFEVLCEVPVLVEGQSGRGESKRAAEQQAAEKVLHVLGESGAEIAAKTVPNRGPGNG